jgi:hypothetical protein
MEAFEGANLFGDEMKYEIERFKTKSDQEILIKCFDPSFGQRAVGVSQVVWSATTPMIDYLWDFYSKSSACRQSCLEIGAGTGIVGIYIARYLTKVFESVIITDNDEQV